MNLSSFFVNKCFEYLLKEERETSEKCAEGPKKQIFPPWASNQKAFKDLCTGCGECVAACKEYLIIIKENGLPVMNLSNNSCTFCGDCARSCSHDALHFSDEQPPWHLHVSVTQDCLMEKKVLCQLCQEQCDHGAIVFPKGGQNDSPPEILLGNCTGCGACAARCPVDAISFQYIDELQI
ncbi:ferredoxin-type protein NapF [Candidatus Electrothrix aarhusensis]|uniref:Ferredoxin-type protein NapF n=1 Tax=Candidatus Electrothrix aarhusensis TaxID=1859131 RepID=A0A444IQG5_9BACT|nr:ferredoxin-type protein NapF [Candidatus Electrothrix aarhusensis]